jgi:hypothetical protein
MVSCARPNAARDATTAELGELPAGLARVCVLRPESIAASVTFEVRDNGRLVGATRGASYFCYLAAPGLHEVTSIDDDTGSRLLLARVGARYWIHQEVSELDGNVHAHLEFVDEASAAPLLDACDTRVRVSIPGHDDNPSSQPIAPSLRM